MTCAIYPGSFDPITFGHIDAIERATKIFDRVIVAVAHNSAKKYLFSDTQRLSFASTALAHLPQVQVMPVKGLIADFAKQNNANAIIKGLRSGNDYFNETPMALLNRNLSGIETVFILADPALAHVSSTFVKEIARYQGSIDKLVPKQVANAIYAKITAKQADSITDQAE